MEHWGKHVGLLFMGKILVQLMPFFLKCGACGICCLPTMNVLCHTGLGEAVGCMVEAQFFCKMAIFLCNLVQVMALLNTCGMYFNKGAARRRLDRFLTFFAAYVLAKDPLPLDIENDLEVRARGQRNWG